MSHKRLSMLMMVLVASLTTSLVLAQTFDASWSTVDCGGSASATGGAFSLSGTIGQPDAGAMSGGAFELNGGFWTPSIGCSCLGDMNGDTAVNGEDVQSFIDCLLSGGPCSCAEFDGEPGLGAGDQALFVDALLSGEDCQWTPPVCTCPGDTNGDSAVDGEDVQSFVDCLLNGGLCGCAELDGVPGLSSGDAAQFVDRLINGAPCL